MGIDAGTANVNGGATVAVPSMRFEPWNTSVAVSVVPQVTGEVEDDPEPLLAAGALCAAMDAACDSSERGPEDGDTEHEMLPRATTAATERSHDMRIPPAALRAGRSRKK
jgi:hypothetical protein